MNKTLATAGKNILKDLLSKCSKPQQLMFKRMYSHSNINLSINDVVDNMDEDKIDTAIGQCERSVQKNVNHNHE